MIDRSEEIKHKGFCSQCGLDRDDLIYRKSLGNYICKFCLTTLTKIVDSEVTDLHNRCDLLNAYMTRISATVESFQDTASRHRGRLDKIDQRLEQILNILQVGYQMSSPWVQKVLKDRSAAPQEQDRVK